MLIKIAVVSKWSFSSLATSSGIDVCMNSGFMLQYVDEYRLSAHSLLEIAVFEALQFANVGDWVKQEAARGMVR